MSEREKEVLQALKVLGFKYIARDSDGELNAYVGKPSLEIGNYYNENDYYMLCRLTEDLFQCIKTKECKKIEEILEND